MIWKGNEIKKLIAKAKDSAMQDAAEEVLNRANKIVPHDEGTLERSGDAQVDKGIGYVSYDTPYAIRLHEHPEYNFQEGREGKWLEKTIKDKQTQKAARDYIADKLKKVMK